MPYFAYFFVAFYLPPQLLWKMNTCFYLKKFEMNNFFVRENSKFEKSPIIIVHEKNRRFENGTNKTNLQFSRHGGARH